MADKGSGGNRTAPWWVRAIGIGIALFLVLLSPQTIFDVLEGSAERWQNIRQIDTASTGDADPVDARDVATTDAIVAGLLPCLGDATGLDQAAMIATTGCDVWVTPGGDWVLTTQGQMRIAVGATGGSGALIDLTPETGPADTGDTARQWTPGRWTIAAVVAVVLVVWTVRRRRRRRNEPDDAGSGPYLRDDGLKVAYPSASAAGGDEFPTPE